MTHLRQDHEELKARYWTLKIKQEAREDSEEKKIKTNPISAALSQTSDNSYNQLRIKRPVRLLPASLLRYLHSSNT
jgi:phage gp36-like protein